MADETSPMEVPGEAAMTSEALERFLAALDEEMILVGGQALAFWMQRFDIPALGANMISRDGDVIGKIGFIADLRGCLLRRQQRRRLAVSMASAIALQTSSPTSRDLVNRGGGACLGGTSGAASSAGLGAVRAAHFVV